MIENYIDISFDVRTDSNGKDPDYGSGTLRQYHRLLWSKNLPSGRLFDLDNSYENVYLKHKSDLGEFYLASDSITHTYYKWKRMQHIIQQIPKDGLLYFYNIAHTIGGYIILPSNRYNGTNTLNQERGMNRRINDRIDLTLECIRRYYNDETSPLYETIKRYHDFFMLFSDFRGYCEFFLLQDLVQDDGTKIKSFLPFDGFINNPLPNSTEEYKVYMNNNIEFLCKRNSRIKKYNEHNA
jgi:hypothetical protein